MKQVIFGFLFILLCTGIYSCDCMYNCDPCPPDSYTWKTIYYYDSSIISKNETKYFYIYELNSSNQIIYFDSMYNQNFDRWGIANSWNLINLNYFNRLTTQNATNKIFIATLKDSTCPVRIENIKIGFKDGGGKGCCTPCDDNFLESIKINGKEYKPEDLPIKIN